MAANSREQLELVVKIVLTERASGVLARLVVLRHIARRHAHDSIKVGEVTGGPVYATEFYWPEELLDGRRLRVRLFALSGRPVDIAVDELLMTDCAGDRGAIDSMLSPGGR